MVQRILVVDDEPHIRDVICFALERSGMSTITARNGREALQIFQRGAVDLVVLDIGMPELDGLEVCRRIRASSGLPILFLSARDEDVDRIIGLEIGGDDYVTKPFSPRELVARVKAILRRSSGSGPGQAQATVLQRGPLRLDRNAHSASFAGIPVHLTRREFDIVQSLLARPEMVFSREQLMAAAHGPQTLVADRTIDSHVRNIRAKFERAGCVAIIATVHGVGFRLAVDAQGET